MIKDLSIAVVTLNRPFCLSKCLESIVNQIDKPRKVIVVDNSRKGTAKKVVDRFISKIEVENVVEPRRGISYARNKVLEINCSKYLGFVDDDCVLDKSWVKEGVKGIIKSRSAYVVGKTSLLNSRNIVARVRFFYYYHWFLSGLNFKTKRLSGYTLDTKNVIFDFKSLKQNGIKFDNRYVAFSLGGGEDMDMGMQLEKLGLHGCYAEKMKLKHQEPEKVGSLIKKAYWSGKASCIFAKKWQLEHLFVGKQMIWKNWLADFWIKPYVNQELLAKANKKKLCYHALIKLYDRAWIQGYIKQSFDPLD